MGFLGHFQQCWESSRANFLLILSKIEGFLNKRTVKL